IANAMAPDKTHLIRNRILSYRRRGLERSSRSLAPASFASKPTNPLAIPPAGGTGERRTLTLRRTVFVAIRYSFHESQNVWRHNRATPRRANYYRPHNPPARPVFSRQSD